MSENYYLKALNYAKNRDLTAATRYARAAIKKESESERVRYLLGLCLYELGALGEAARMFSGKEEFVKRIMEEKRCTDETLRAVKELVSKKKWRKARKLAETLPRQSVRILMIRGCISAAMKRYSEAAAFFAHVLEKDSGNKAAMALLKKTAQCSKGMWGNYEKLLRRS